MRARLYLFEVPWVYFPAWPYVYEAPWVYGGWEWGGLAPYRPRWPILVNITDTHPIVLLYKPTFTRLHPQILLQIKSVPLFLGATLFWSLSI